jgi:hypothetical protein
MALGKWKEFGAYWRAYSSEWYKETTRAAEHLASSSLTLLENKPEEERRIILSKAQSLSEKLTNVVASEAPMVGAVALMTALRVHEQLIQEQAKQNG